MFEACSQICYLTGVNFDAVVIGLKVTYMHTYKCLIFLPSAVDGELTSWSNWTECTRTCGFGEQYRYRDCDGPYYGGLDCQEQLNETRACNQFYCPGN